MTNEVLKTPMVNGLTPKERKILKKYRELFSKAKNQPYIRNPEAWALYHTWKHFDGR